MNAYAYFDENGALKEYITDPSIRSGNSGYNHIKVYWKDAPTVTAMGYRFAKIGGVIGPENVGSITTSDVVIPSYSDRDLSYFVQGQTYAMYDIPVTGLTNGSYKLTITFYSGTTVMNLAMITLLIEDEIAVYDYQVSKSQFDLLLERVGGQSGYLAKYNTILVKSIDFNGDADGLATRNLTITSYPVSSYIIDMINEGKVAIRFNYSRHKGGRVREKESGSPRSVKNHIYGFVNCYYMCNEKGIYEKFEDDKIASYYLLHITSSDIKTSKTGDKYISKTFDLGDFITKSILQLNTNQFTLEDLTLKTNYLSFASVKNNEIADGFLQTYKYFNRKVDKYGAVRKLKYTRFGLSMLNNGYLTKRKLFPTGQILDNSSFALEDVRSPSGFGYVKAEGIVFPLSYTRKHTRLGEEEFNLTSPYILNHRMWFRQKYNPGGLSLIYSADIYGRKGSKQKIKYGLYSKFVPSFCILKDDYLNEKTYMYEATFPLFDKKVCIDFRPDYKVTLSGDFYVNSTSDLSFGVKVEVK